MSLINRTIEHQDLHPKTATPDKLFHLGPFLAFLFWHFREQISTKVVSVDEFSRIC